MAEVVLFHHAHGLTSGVQEFAEGLRQSGHPVHVPDLYQGKLFDDLAEGIAYAETEGFGEIMERGRRAVEELPGALVFAGFSLGVLPAQLLAQSRAEVQGALLFHSCIPVREFGTWPAGVPVQIHAMEADEFFTGQPGESELDAARALVAEAERAELFLYPGSGHLFADPSLPGYDPAAAKLLRQRVHSFLDRLPAGG